MNMDNLSFLHEIVCPPPRDLAYFKGQRADKKVSREKQMEKRKLLKITMSKTCTFHILLYNWNSPLWGPRTSWEQAKRTRNRTLSCIQALCFRRRLVAAPRWRGEQIRIWQQGTRQSWACSPFAHHQQAAQRAAAECIQGTAVWAAKPPVLQSKKMFRPRKSLPVTMTLRWAHLPRHNTPISVQRERKMKFIIVLCMLEDRFHTVQ